MKINKLVKICVMLAVVAIVFGAHASSSYGQETSTTDGTTALATPLPPAAYVNAGVGYELKGSVVLAEPTPRGSFYPNLALGIGALFSNTTGEANMASGYMALFNNTTGTFNTASGLSALYSNTTEENNTAIGSMAMFYSTGGNDNTGVGAYVLYRSTGGDNTATGYQALVNNNVGANNTATGFEALSANTTGNNNTAFGNEACSNLVTGRTVICIGSKAGPATDIPGPATYIGGIFGAPTTGSGNPLVCVDSTGLLGTTGCASMDNPHEQQEIINHQQVQIETLQRQNEELQQRMSRLESLIAKK